MTTAHMLTWADDIALDIIGAEHTVTLTALSCQPPRGTANTPLNRLWLALVSASARKRDVTLIIAAQSPSNPATWRNNTGAERAAAFGIRAILVPLPRLLHAKTSLIDSRIAWAGSGNLTAAAAHFNFEFWLRTTDAAPARDMLRFHNELRAAGAL